MNTLDIEPLKEFLSVAIAYIIDTRVKRNRPPFFATDSNIRNVVAGSLDRALGEMAKEGLLTERATLNSKAYEFTPPKQTTLKRQ